MWGGWGLNIRWRGLFLGGFVWRTPDLNFGIRQLGTAKCAHQAGDQDFEACCGPTLLTIVDKPNLHAPNPCTCS